ncbi:MAG: GNAT family N-acetyltransferase [Anaerolineaceae bacterium]|nr:GNAT family N-acetyltransferase [Anaerolineaceae bacterium]MBN2677651.1 GNAT family N-acetyltransferase [Anaerolineaceae bacterium]
MSSKAVVRAGTEKDLRAVGQLWKKLDAFHRTVGLNFPVTEALVEEWIASFIRTLERFSFLWVAEQAGEIEGFLLGRLKKAPTYLGGVMVGEISDLYVSDALRGQGAGRQLVETAMQHFHSIKVHSVEVQIMSQNKSGVAFWNSMGFKEEVVLVRRMIDPGTQDA